VTAEQDLVIEALLDGNPYVVGTQITAIGVHTLLATATDAAGNRGYSEPVTFEIRKFPMVEGVAVVSDMTCTRSGRFALLDATVYIAADNGQASPLDVETMALWPLNQNGLPLNEHAIYVAGSTSPAGHYEYASAEAEYQQGYWALHFSAITREDQILDCPTSFRITASGNRETSQEFDFEAECVAQINPQPIAFLQLMGVLNNDPPKAPPAAPPCPPCKWKEKRVNGPKDTINASIPNNCFGGKQYWTANLAADGGHISAEAFAVDECTGNAVASKSVTSDAVMTVWLEGRKECCDPSITVTLKPKFKAKVQIDPPAQAIAAGLIDIVSTIGAATRAIGGVECSDNPATTITFGAGASVGKDGPAANANISVQMNLTQGANENEDTFIGNDIKKGNVDMVKISIVGVAKTKTLADASLFNWYAHAKAWIWASTPGITVEPACNQNSQCPGVSATFEYK
jgi:hypothetical protein